MHTTVSSVDQVSSLHGCTAIIVRELPIDPKNRPMCDGIPCRLESVELRLVDGSAWLMDQLMVPTRAPSITFKRAAKFLQSCLRNKRGPAPWRMIHPPRSKQPAAV